MNTAWILILFFLPGLGACVTTRQDLIRQRESQDLDRPPTPKVIPIAKADPAPAPVPTASPTPTPAAIAPSSPPMPAPEATPSPSPTPVAIPKDLSALSDDELRVELAQTLGKNEELQRDSDLKARAHAEEMKKAEERIAGLEKQLKELMPEAPRAPEGKSPFDAGKDAHAAGNWDEAIAFFNQTLAGADKGKQVEEATYLRGESYFRKLQYNKAILDFSKFPERFQKSSFHPKALLKIAESFESMGRKDDARMFYSELQEKFPKTAEGKIAKKKLSR